MTQLLDRSVNVADLKDFLDYYSHPLYPEQRYIDLKIYKDAKTTKEVLKSLFPVFINYQHLYLLEDIVEEFGHEDSRQLLDEYKSTFDRKRKLNTMPAPITDEEIEQSHGVKKLRVFVVGDAEDTTVERFQEIAKSVANATGISVKNIIPAFQDPGNSVILTFIIPASIFHIFLEPCEEDLEILANTGILKLEIDEQVIDNIQRFETEASTEQVTVSRESTKPTSREYYLRQRKHEISLKRYFHLVKMHKGIPDSEFDELCSDDFLTEFSKDLRDWIGLAPYFGLHDWNVEEIVDNYPNEDDQKRVALLYWKSHEGDMATYHNLLETLLLHGKIEEVEALLGKLGPGQEPCQLSVYMYIAFYIGSRAVLCAPDVMHGGP